MSGGNGLAANRERWPGASVSPAERDGHSAGACWSIRAAQGTALIAVVIHSATAKRTETLKQGRPCALVCPKLGDAVA